jgi:hypothetical protein
MAIGRESQPLGRDDLRRGHDIKIEDILIDLQNGEQNLEFKTEVINPLALAGTQVFAEYLTSKRLVECGDMVKAYRKDYLKLMASFQRGARREIINAISSIIDKETIRMSFADRLTTTMR